MNLWVKILKDYLGLKSGEQVKLADEATKKQLVEGGWAEDCPDPSGDILKTAGDQLALQISNAAEKSLASTIDARLKEFATGAGDAISKIRLPAIAKDHSEDDRRGFKSRNEYLTAVMKAMTPNGTVDKRLEPLTAQRVEKAAGSDEARIISDPSAGFLMPVAFMPEPMKIDPENDPISAGTTKIPMQVPIVKLNARVDKDHRTSVSGGLVVTRKPETVAGNPSKMSLEQISMEAHDLFGVSYASEQILAYSPISFVALLRSGFSEEFSSHMIDERLNGTGAGEFLGINNSPAMITVDKETDQPANTILFENAVNMRARCWRYSQAVWLANHDCLPTLMKMNQVVGTSGVPAWQSSARDGEPDRLLGRPIIFTEYCKTIGTVGDLVLANWTQYLDGLLQPMQSAESIHVRFLHHEKVFKFWMSNAGQPWWRSTLRTKNSAQTLSPFVRLATRA